jgi:hypothetical protein
MGAQGEVFVPFHNQIVLKKASEQVVSICSLSGKEYLILDSEGKLHLLVLQNYHRGVERMILQQQIPQAPLDAFMQPLPCAIKIKTLAVLPLASTGENPPASGMSLLYRRVLNRTLVLKEGILLVNIGCYILGFKEGYCIYTYRCNSMNFYIRKYRQFFNFDSSYNIQGISI